MVAAAVHTLPPAVAMSVTLGPTSMTAVTALVCGSMRHSLPVAGVSAQTASLPAVTAAAVAPNGIERATRLLVVSTRNSAARMRCATQTARGATATASGAMTAGTRAIVRPVAGSTRVSMLSWEPIQSEPAP